MDTYFLKLFVVCVLVYGPIIWAAIRSGRELGN
jgi:hypothetical protein